MTAPEYDCAEAAVPFRTELDGLPVRLSIVERDRLTAHYQLAARLGLQPALDETLATCSSECPACRSGETDPLGIWQPLVAYCADHLPVTRLECAGGCPAALVVEALTNQGRVLRHRVLELEDELNAARGEQDRLRDAARLLARDLAAAESGS